MCAQKEAERRRLAAIPGLLPQSEVVEDMADT